MSTSVVFTNPHFGEEKWLYEYDYDIEKMRCLIHRNLETGKDESNDGEWFSNGWTPTKFNDNILNGKWVAVEGDMRGFVTVDVELYGNLVKDSNFLIALQACGVDNWDGYEQAQEMMEG